MSRQHCTANDPGIPSIAPRMQSPHPLRTPAPAHHPPSSKVHMLARPLAHPVPPRLKKLFIAVLTAQMCVGVGGAAAVLLGSGPGVTISLVLPTSVVALAASDPSAHFVVTNTDPVDGSGTSSCAGATTFNPVTGVLSASNCGYGTYSVKVMQTKAAAGPQVSPSRTPGPVGGAGLEVGNRVVSGCE